MVYYKNMNNKVLLVDDDLFLRDALYEFLLNEGVNVVCAEDGEEAIGLLDDSIGCLVTDMAMPNLDGVSLVQRVKASYPDIRIVAISGGRIYPADLYLQLAKKAGADEVFTKPFDLEDFLRSVVSS